MGGYYIPSSYSANYVNNKKNDDGTYVYDTALSKVGIDTQKSLQQLTKQYNNTLSNAYAGYLTANKGLRSSYLNSGYKEAFKKSMLDSLNNDLSEYKLSVQSTKQSLFESLASNVDYVDQIRQSEIANMRRMAGSLEEYYSYVQTLRNSGNYYTTDQGFKTGDEWTFEDNYDLLFGTQKGIISNYLDDNANTGLSWEDWLRQNSGTSDEDTAWLDWVYGGGSDQFKDFIKNGVRLI